MAPVRDNNRLYLMFLVWNCYLIYYYSTDNVYSVRCNNTIINNNKATERLAGLRLSSNMRAVVIIRKRVKM